jgi:hypothetical protein
MSVLLSGQGPAKEALAGKLGLDPSTLSKPGGIKELMARDLERNDTAVGYYRTDQPPVVLAGPAAGAAGGGEPLSDMENDILQAAACGPLDGPALARLGVAADPLAAAR